MKRMTVRLLTALTLMLASPFVWAQYTAGAGLTGTPHDFGGLTVATETTGACTFCHTPHKATAQALLWNQTAAPAATYGWTNALTSGGTPLGSRITTGTNVGPSVKCFSCHDGSLTIGDIAWFNATDPDTTGQVTVTADYQVGNSGNLDGNHPVGVPYPFNDVASSYNNATTGAGAELSDWINDPTAVGIRLFNDSTDDGQSIAAGAVEGSTGIECSSCHDPHNGAQTLDQFFLRGTVGQGTDYICGKCHDRT